MMFLSGLLGFVWPSLVASMLLRVAISFFFMAYATSAVSIYLSVEI